jgi:hypothetical protein
MIIDYVDFSVETLSFVDLLSLTLGLLYILEFFSSDYVRFFVVIKQISRFPHSSVKLCGTSAVLDISPVIKTFAMFALSAASATPDRYATPAQNIATLGSSVSSTMSRN